VKGKVSAWIMRDPHVGETQREAARAQSRGLFDLAVRYALKNQRVLLVFCGVSGSGKSTLAAELSARLQCAHIATDVVRDELVPRGAPVEQRYDPEISRRVYETICQRAAKLLAANNLVVLDGTFLSAQQRTQAAAIARENNACSVLLWADCPAEHLSGHIDERNRAQTLFGSEATHEISKRQQSVFIPPAPGEGFDAICRLDTSLSSEHTRSLAWDCALDAIADALQK
jgi:predicted kinase